MKRFDEIYQSDPNDPEFLEARLPRLGVDSMFASQSMVHGNKAERFFDKGMIAPKNNALVSGAKRLESLRKALTELSKELVETRHQICASTSLALTSIKFPSSNLLTKAQQL